MVLFYLTRPTGNDFLLKGGLEVKGCELDTSCVLFTNPVCTAHTHRYILYAVSAGCEISTGPGTNASEILVGPVKNLLYCQLNY